MLELARTNTSLTGAPLRHAQRLVATWQPLADLCFSDLLLFAPVGGEEGQRFFVLAQVRPTTAQTLYPTDLVGKIVNEDDRPVVARTWRKGEVVSGEATVIAGTEPVLVQGIPVRHHDELVGVVSRETAVASGRRPGELERQYSEVFDAFAGMVADGTFPFAIEVELDDAPRVADGVIVLDDALRVRFASPNAISSLHRMGIYSNAEGMQLAAIGFGHHAAEAARRTRLPVIEEFERAETTVLVEAIPLLAGSHVSGALLLVRDVTDLRQRDRILMSKDATIREIHHRVKNNLQTVAALLRLQGRRLTSEEARGAIEESERRVRSMALVHEVLSREMGDVVALADLVSPLARAVEETVSTPELRLRFEVHGDAGEVPGEVATPLAVVLNELMQNAVDHGFAATGHWANGTVRIDLARDGDVLVIDVADNGVGLPDGFSLEESTGLGLSIVRALVTGELAGSIELRNDDGARARLRIPVQAQERAVP